MMVAVRSYFPMLSDLACILTGEPLYCGFPFLHRPVRPLCGVNKKGIRPCGRVPFLALEIIWIRRTFLPSVSEEALSSVVLYFFRCLPPNIFFVLVDAIYAPGPPRSFCAAYFLFRLNPFLAHWAAPFRLLLVAPPPACRPPAAPVPGGPPCCSPKL